MIGDFQYLESSRNESITFKKVPIENNEYAMEKKLEAQLSLFCSLSFISNQELKNTRSLIDSKDIFQKIQSSISSCFPILICYLYI